MAVAERRYIKFNIEKGTKRPTSLNEYNTLYALYSPKSIKRNPGDFKYLTMNFSIDLPEEIIGTFAIVPSLKIERLQMLHNTNTNCRQKIRFELFNKNHNKKM